MPRLSYQDRRRLAPRDFALPNRKTAENPAGRGAYPIEDASHARNALARVAQHGTSEEQARVRSKVHAKFPGIGQRRRLVKGASGKYQVR